jgi:hypothetical protein
MSTSNAKSTEADSTEPDSPYMEDLRPPFQGLFHPELEPLMEQPSLASYVQFMNTLLAAILAQSQSQIQQSSTL